MGSVNCFVAALPNPKAPWSSEDNVERLLSTYRCTRIPVRRSACMCQKESNSENHSPRHRDKAEGLSTTPNFIEPKAKKNELRNTEFAFILTSLVTAAAGGPIITAWSALYFLVGRENDVPLWLCSFASLLCSALTDAFIWNFSNAHQNPGIVPYLLFALGTGVSAVFDFDEFFRIAIPNGLQTGKPKQSDGSSESKSREQSPQTANDLCAWDKAFRGKLDDQE